MDFSYRGRDFKVRKVDAMKQYHLARRLGPILIGVLAAAKVKIGVATTPEAMSAVTEEKKLEMIEAFAAPVLDGLSKLSNVDAEFVLLGLLSAVEVKQSAGNWGSVATESMIMMQDLELPALLHLAGRAFMHNLSGFFSALPQ